MEFPVELKYTKDHEWLKVIDGNTALVGITEFAQSELGDIVYIDINTVGNELKADDVFGTVEAVKTVSDLFLPIAAKIVEINPELENAPELVNTDPYGKGWMARIEISNISDVESLLSANDYKALVG